MTYSVPARAETQKVDVPYYAEAEAAAQFATLNPKADPVVQVPNSIGSQRENWRQKFLEQYRASGGTGNPQFIAPHELPTLEQVHVPVDYDAVQAAKTAALNPDAVPVVQVPPGSSNFREQWRKDFLESYKKAGGRVDPDFIKPVMPETPTIYTNYPDAPAATVIGPPPSARKDTPPAAGAGTTVAAGAGTMQEIKSGLGTGAKIVGGLQNAGAVAGSVRKESESAAKDGREFDPRNAAESAVGEVLGASAFNTGKKNAEAAITKAQAEGGSKIGAAAEALGDTAKDMTGYSTSSRINQEEALKEFENATREGRAPNLGITGAKGTAAVRVVGEVTGMNSIFDAATYDSEADRQAADTARRLHEKIKDELEGHLMATGALERRMKEMKATGDMKDPSQRGVLRDLQSQYLERRKQAQDLNNRTRGRLDESDPQLIAIRQAVDLLPENPAGVDMNEKPEPTPAELIAQHDCSAYPHTKAGWNETMQAPGCFCVDGYTFNANKTACLPISEAAVKNKDCSPIPGTAPVWNESRQQAVCECSNGFRWNADRSGCVSTMTEQIQALDCSGAVNSVALWDEQAQKAYCGCLQGYEPNRAGNGCVPDRNTQMANASCAIAGSFLVWSEEKGMPVCRCPDDQALNKKGTACVPRENYSDYLARTAAPRPRWDSQTTASALGGLSALGQSGLGGGNQSSHSGTGINPHATQWNPSYGDAINTVVGGGPGSGSQPPPYSNPGYGPVSNAGSSGGVFMPPTIDQFTQQNLGPASSQPCDPSREECFQDTRF